MGLTLEGKMAYLTKFQVQAGVTLQQSHYNEPHVWNPDAPAVKKMMRTPNYRIFKESRNRFVRNQHRTGICTGKSNRQWFYRSIGCCKIAVSIRRTHHFLQPVPGFLENPITVNTKDFFDISLKAAYDFKLYKSIKVILIGIENILYSGVHLQIHRLVEFKVVCSLQAYVEEVLRIHRYRIFKESRSFFAGVKISY